MDSLVFLMLTLAFPIIIVVTKQRSINLKEKGISTDILTQITAMGVAEGTKLADSISYAVYCQKMSKLCTNRAWTLKIICERNKDMQYNIAARFGRQGEHTC